MSGYIGPYNPPPSIDDTPVSPGPSSDPLVLGNIVFTAFAVPPSISWGGKHQLVIHKLPGGERVIDAMGRDDAMLTWSATFLGPDAMAQARAVDALRIDGSVQMLTWGGQAYSVVVSDFAPTYRHFAHIPYRISCTVVADLSGQPADTSYDPDAAALQDMILAQASLPLDAPQDLTIAVTTEALAISPYSIATIVVAPPPLPTLAPVAVIAPGLPGYTALTVDLGPAVPPSGIGPIASTAAAIAVMQTLAAGS